MFYGAQIKPGQTVSPSMEDGGEILHLSQICLVDAKDESRTYVNIHDGKSSFCVAVLQKDKCETAAVDLFVSTATGVKLSTRGGKNEVHVVGYFEPEGHEGEEESDEETDDEQFINHLSDSNGKIEDLDDEEDEDDDEMDDEQIGKQIKSVIAGKDKNAAKKKKTMTNGSVHDENNDIAECSKNEDFENEFECDDDDSDNVSEDGDDDEGKISGDEEEKEKKKEIVKGKKITSGQNKQSVAANQSSQKRKAQNKANGSDPKKQKSGDSKTPNSVGSVSYESFQNELKKYLAANGKTNLGILGQKVKKPAVIEKLGHYLKEHPTIFKVENGFVSLVK